MGRREPALRKAATRRRPCTRRQTLQLQPRRRHAAGRSRSSKDQHDIYLAYNAALNEQAKAFVALEQAAGIWDIDF